MADLKQRAKRSRQACQVLQNPTGAYDEIQNLRQQLEQAEARVAELEEPDQFWDADNADINQGCPFEIADYHGQDMRQSDEVVVDVLCAKDLPKRRMRVWINANDETEFEWLDQVADEAEKEPQPEGAPS